MKQSALLWGVPILLFCLISCPQDAVQNPYQDLKTGTFWARDWTSQDGTYYPVDSVLLTAGEKCLVWAERSAGIAVADGEALAREFDQGIYDKIMGVFGSDGLMKKYDREGKLTLFLLDIKDGFAGKGAYTAGYFSSADLLFAESFRYSNERAMIYVDTYPSKIRSEDSYTTIAHEFQHFISHASRSLNNKSGLETWIDEGLSAAAEQIYLGRHNRERISHFSSSETIKEGNNFFVWGEKMKEHPNSILDEYATVYLFFQWLRLQSEGSKPDIFRRIIESERNDYRAVVEAVSETFAGKLDSANWDGILRSWLAANYLNSPEGIYGYRGEITGLRVWALGGSTKYLLPGEGVYSAVGDNSGALPLSGGPNIKYAGLFRGAGATPAPQLSLDTLYPRGRLLTYNCNEKGPPWAPEMGVLTKGEEETIPGFPSTGTGRSAAGDSWIIDARDIGGRPRHGDDRIH